MAEITAGLVKELRETSGAGMMDCKKALVENDGDLDAAVDWLRTKGPRRRREEGGRVAAEGLVAVATDGVKGAVVEINSETDFVARNPEFQAFVGKVASVALTNGGDAETVSGAQMDGKSVQDTLTSLIGTIGENMAFRRAASLSVGEGVVASYVHSAAAPDMGRIGVLVALEGSGDTAKLADFGKQLAMHVAAANPQWVSQDEVDGEALSSASGWFSPSRPRRPASPTTSSRRWSRAAFANTTRRSAFLTRPS